jgi:hypothetical protein
MNRHIYFKNRYSLVRELVNLWWIRNGGEMWAVTLLIPYGGHTLTLYIILTQHKHSLFIIIICNYSHHNASQQIYKHRQITWFLISNFHLVLYVLCSLLRNSPASVFYMPTFRNTLCVPSSKARRQIMTNIWERLRYPYEQGFGLKIA